MAEKMAAAAPAVSVGETVSGTVEHIAPYGAFVRLESGQKAMVHISELSHNYVKKVEDVLEQGQKVTAKVIKIDDKGRLVLPSAFKSAVPEGEDLKFVVKKDIFADCLEMYTFTEWDRQSEEVKSRLDIFNSKHMLFWREYMRNRAIVEPDPKIGRISIPKKMLEAIGVNKEVVFAGSDFKIEIWAKERYEESGISGEEFISLAESLHENR